jgi:polar amino acid transport system substrate-binding protein
VTKATTNAIMVCHAVRLWLSVLVFLMLPALGVASTDQGPQLADRALTKLIDEQKQATQGCQSTTNTLQSVLCKGVLRIGIRTSYKGFGLQTAGELVGFEIDLARHIAEELGVKPEFVPVTAADRIRKLIDGDIDMILATMAHTPDRAKVVSFIRPHYYASPTAVAGLKARDVSGLQDMELVSICVPLGSYANITFAQARARMLMFDKPQRMFDALRFGACDLVAHDRSLILGEVTGPLAPNDMREHYEEKFSFNEISWGMAVRHDDAATLGRALALIMASAHGEGLMIVLAQRHGVNATFLDDQRALWDDAACYLPDGSFLEDCLIDAPHIGDSPSKLAPKVNAIRNWLQQHFGVEVHLPMLSGQEGFRLFTRGIVVSIILVICAIFATILFGLLFYRLNNSRLAVVRTVNWAAIVLGSNAPIILLLVMAYLIMSSFMVYTAPVAVLTAVLAIGLNNGAPAARALIAAAKTLGDSPTLLGTIHISMVQLRACVINAAKSSPIGAFIGAPELLSVLTDITSFSGERAVTFTLLAVFYILVVQAVIIASGWTARALQKRAPG